MIELHRINGGEFVLNADLICRVESTPDTLITLTTGEKIRVQEAVAEVVRLAVSYQKTVQQLGNQNRSTQ